MAIQRVTLAGLLKIELPGHTVLLCDGGTLAFDGDSYSPRDSLFGVLSGCGAISEGGGDETPGVVLTFLPDPDAAAADLTAPELQGSRLRLWIAEVDEETGLISGTPDLVADAIVDVPKLRFPDSGRVLEVECVSVWERLLGRNEGNLLNGGFHKRLYPAETGLDNATGVSRTVAWGTKSVRGTVTSASGWAGSVARQIVGRQQSD